MKKYLICFLFLTSCALREPAPPCLGTEEQIYRCQSLRNQEKIMKMIRNSEKENAIGQNQLIWDNYRRQHVGY